MNQTRFFSLLLMAVVLLTACNDGQTDTTQTEKAASTAATQAVSATAAASAASSASAASVALAGDVAAGKGTYGASCAGCHGAAGAGGMGPAMAASAAWSTEDFALAVREGQVPSGSEMKSSMPRFTESQLSDADLTNVHSYLASLN